jgi:Domain of unknown function (DUF4129)
VVTAAGGYRLAGALALASGEPGGGLDIGRRAAQRLAHAELSKAMYQPSLTQRFLDWLNRVLDRVNVNVPGGWWALIALIVAAVLVIAVVIFQIRPARSGRGREGVLLHGSQVSAQDHRQQSERHAAAGDFSAAIIERMRAIAVGLQERDILPPRPGRTADELAADAGRALPSHALALTGAAQLFDDIMYGGRDGTEPGYQRVRELDVSLQAARPASTVTLLPAGASGPVS